MQMLFTCSSFHALMSRTAVFIYRISCDRTSRLVRGEGFEVKTISNIRDARREWELRLWHYFGAGTCSDVNGNQVIGCIDRVAERYERRRKDAHVQDT